VKASRPALLIAVSFGYGLFISIDKGPFLKNSFMIPLIRFYAIMIDKYERLLEDCPTDKQGVTIRINSLIHYKEMYMGQKLEYRLSVFATLRSKPE
jgi:hypothetical protein